MGTRGPNAKPNRLRVLEGNPSGRPLRREVKPRVAKLTPPKGLGPRGRALFAMVAKELAALGLSSRLDTPTLGVLAEIYERMVEAREDLKEARKTNGDKQVYEVPRGPRIALPEIKIYRAWVQEFLRHARAFGLTPLARAAMSAVEQEETGDDSLLDP